MNSYSVTVYTDGGSRNTGNIKGGHVLPNDKAAWAYLIFYKNKKYAKSCGALGATNNQMELSAMLEALRKLYRMKLTQENILLISDSKYVLNSINKGWLYNWAKNNWINSAKQEVKNRNLWEAVYKALPHFPKIKFKWTKGHANSKGNIYVDKLLNQTMDKM